MTLLQRLWFSRYFVRDVFPLVAIIKAAMLNEAYDNWPGDIGCTHAYSEGNTRGLVLSVCTLT